MIHATATESQPTYASRARAFKLLLLLVIGDAQTAAQVESQDVLLFLVLVLKPNPPWWTHVASQFESRVNKYTSTIIIGSAQAQTSSILLFLKTK